MKDDKYGLIDNKGREVLPPVFMWAGDVSADRAMLYVCGRMVYVDRKRRIHLIPEPPLRAAPKDGKFGFLNPKGQFAIAPQFETAYGFQEGLAVVKIGGKWGFIDTRGRMVLPPVYDDAFGFDHGVAFVSNPDRLIDRRGRVLAEGLRPFGNVREGRIPVLDGSAWGFVDLRGRIVVPLEYDGAQEFSDGLAAVAKDGKWGYIDRSGRVVLPLIYDQADWFGQGLAPVRLGEDTLFIRKDGSTAFRLPSAAAGSFFFKPYSDVTWFSSSAGNGYVTTKGTIIYGPAPGWSPSHPPLFGWSDEERAESCEGIPDDIRRQVDRLR